MAMARRDLLSLGALAAVATVATSCSRSDVGTPGGAPTTTPAARAVEPVTGARFPGQPPAGSVYYGASVPRHTPLVPWEQRIGATLALHRSYFTPDHNEIGQLVHRVRDDHKHGRLPHVSIKPSWAWAEIGEGQHDDWLGRVFDKLADEQLPVFLTLHHEPENESGPAGMQPSDYVAMQTHAIRLAARAAPQVTVVPVLQHWTFDPLRTDIEPSTWLVPSAAVMGLDVYNPWSATNGKEWRTFGSKLSEVLHWFGDTPLAIGEYGCRVDPRNPGLAAEWVRDAAQFAREHNIVSMSYFNSHVNSPDGTWALHGESEETFAELLSSQWVARV